MLQSAFNLFALRKLPWSSFNFPRWQALLGFALIGILTGFDPSMREPSTDVPAMSLGRSVAYSLLMVLVCIPVIVGFLRWWMQRGGRWDGQGDMFNLVAASWLMADVLSAGLAAVGIPMLWILPLWLYSFWVGGNALSGAIPKASLAYSIGGIVVAVILAMIPAMIVAVLVMI